jgi:hypothetical protein
LFIKGHFFSTLLFRIEGTVWRERALKIVLVLVGLLFVATIYPVVRSPWHPSPSDDTGDTMMTMSLLGLHIPSERTGFLIGSAVLVLIGVALLALAPPKHSSEQPSPTSA